MGVTGRTTGPNRYRAVEDIHAANHGQKWASAVAYCPSYARFSCHRDTTVTLVEEQLLLSCHLPRDGTVRHISTRPPHAPNRTPATAGRPGGPIARTLFAPVAIGWPPSTAHAVNLRVWASGHSGAPEEGFVADGLERVR